MGLNPVNIQETIAFCRKDTYIYCMDNVLTNGTRDFMKIKRGVK